MSRGDLWLGQYCRNDDRLTLNFDNLIFPVALDVGLSIFRRTQCAMDDEPPPI